MTVLAELRAGVESIEAMLAVLLGQRVAKALDPLKDRDFLLIVEQVSAKLRGATADEEQAAVLAALDALDVRWEDLSPKQLDRVVAASNKALERVVRAAPPKVEAVLEVEGPKLRKATRASARRTYRLDIEADLSQRDLTAEKAIRTTTTNFVRDQYGRRVDAISARAREIVARGHAAGLGPLELAPLLRQNLGDRVTRSDSYWRLIAASFANKGRIHSQLVAFDEAGLTRYRFVAVLDEATTDACRFYNGKVFSTQDGLAAMDRAMTLEDPDQVAEANPWIQTGKDEDGKPILYVDKGGKRVTVARIKRSGVGAKDDVGTFSRGLSTARLVELGAPSPPLHGHCRSNIVPDS